MVYFAIHLIYIILFMIGNDLNERGGGMAHILFFANHELTLRRFRLELIQRLISQGHEVTVALPPARENRLFLELGCEVREVPLQRHGLNPVQDLLLFLRCIRLFQEMRPDVVFSYTIKPNIYGSMAARVTGTRIVCNITGTGTAFLRENWLSRLVRVLYRHSIRKATLVFFQNESDQRYFCKHHLVEGNDELLPWGSGVNLAAFQPSPMPEDDITHFLYVGRVLKIKGIDLFLRCAERLRAEGIPAVCHIAGFVDEKGYAEKLRVLHQKGVVDYLGYCADMTEPLRNCHCVVLPSLGGEGVPNVLLEAAASGRACIASRIPGSTETVEDGVTGYLCRMGDENDLFRCMAAFTRLSSEEKESMGRAGRRRMEERFDRERVIDRYVEVVQMIDKGRGVEHGRA